MTGQSIFHLSQFTLLLHDFERRGNNLGFAYFHGRPGTPGMPEFDACFETMRRRHAEIDRVQVTNAAMEELVLGTGMAPEKVHRIPIGIDVDAFPPAPPEARERAARVRPAGVGVRRRLVPEGRRRVGRGARAEADQGPGRAPRRRGAPARARPRALVPPHRARRAGTSAAGLERLGIPYRHALLPRRRRRGAAYHARSTSASSPPATRAGRGPSSRRWRPACRS